MEDSALAKALETLEAAVVKDRDNLRSLINDNYSSLKDALTDSKADMAQAVNTTTRRAVEAATRAREFAEIKAKEIALTVGKGVQANPWAYVGVVIAVGILVGYILGRDKPPGKELK